MNTLEQITNELLEAGYTIEEIIAAFNEAIIKQKQMIKRIANDIAICFY